MGAQGARGRAAGGRQTRHENRAQRASGRGYGAGQATFDWADDAYSRSASQMTRLRPWRLAA
jgi:hypothetical protein